MGNEKEIKKSNEISIDVFSRLASCPIGYGVVLGFFKGSKNNDDFVIVSLAKPNNNELQIGCSVETVFCKRSFMEDFDSDFTSLCLGAYFKPLYSHNGTFQVVNTVKIK